MNLKEYKQKLKEHDWYYVMTDDPRVYDEGLAKETELKRLAENNKSFKSAYEKHFQSLFKTNANGTTSKGEKATSKKAS